MPKLMMYARHSTTFHMKTVSEFHNETKDRMVDPDAISISV